MMQYVKVSADSRKPTTVQSRHQVILDNSQVNCLSALVVLPEVLHDLERELDAAITLLVALHSLLRNPRLL